LPLFSLSAAAAVLIIAVEAIGAEAFGRRRCGANNRRLVPPFAAFLSGRRRAGHLTGRAEAEFVCLS
jgi:hypothetical protein